MSTPEVLPVSNLPAVDAAISALRTGPSNGAVKPHLIIRPSSRWAALNLHEVWSFRDLLFSLAGRDLKLRYKQTALGVVWVILQPLIAAAIFAVVLGRIARMPSDGIRYFPFAFAGLLAWTLFSNIVVKTSTCLIGSSQLISKVFFPRLILPLSTVPSLLVDFAVSVAMMVVLLFFYQIPPHWGMLMLPVWLILLIVFSLGIGFFTSALTVSYRDVPFIVPVMMQMIFWTTPVAYSLTETLHKLSKSMRFAYMLNPLTTLTEGFRWSVLGSGFVQWGYVLYAAIFSIATFAIGAFTFKSMERKFADVI